MRLTARLATLERQKSGAPALVKQWVDMLTALSTATMRYDAPYPDDVAPSPPIPHVDDDAIRREAERYAATGSPATISDLFRLVRDAKGAE